MSVERFIDAGDHIAAVGWTRGRTRQGGVAFDVAVTHVWTVRDAWITAVPGVDRHAGHAEGAIPVTAGPPQFAGLRPDRGTVQGR